MSFSEIEFALFLPVAWLLYWLLPRRRVPQNAALLLFSYLFYASWDWRFLALVIAGTLVDFAVVRALAAPDDAASASRRRGLVAVSLAASLGALGFFKYENFFAESANALLRAAGLASSVPVLDLLLPIGISFFTLQRVGYVLDVYWRRAPGPTSLLDFANFCCFFPQLTAGPIARGSELLVQLEQPRRFSPEMLANGAAAFLLGFALKAWAGDAIGASWVAPVFANPAAWSSAALWFATVGFALQVFGDFAGYSLMAIGVARFFALELPQNFDYPFVSRSLPELWRRWHITLNRWLFDYIFTPLTTSRGFFRGRIYLALMITFLASGVWHGAAWTFVAWGVLHGVGMVVHQVWDEYYKGLCRKDRRFVTMRRSGPYALAAWGLTLGFFVLTMIPFRAASAGDAWFIVTALFGHEGRGPALGGIVGLGALLGAAFIVAYHLASLRPFVRWRDAFFAAPPLLRGAVYGAVVLFLVVFAPVGSGSFIYQQF